MAETTTARGQGPEVLRALGRFVVALLAFGGTLSLMIFVVLPFAGTHDTIGTILMILNTLALLGVGVWAMTCKIVFISLFVPWMFETLLSLRRGRQLVGLAILVGGVWMGIGLAQAWWAHPGQLTSRRIKEAILAAGLAVTAVGMGLAMIVAEPDEPAPGPDRDRR